MRELSILLVRPSRFNRHQRNPLTTKSNRITNVSLHHMSHPSILHNIPCHHRPRRISWFEYSGTNTAVSDPTEAVSPSAPNAHSRGSKHSVRRESKQECRHLVARSATPLKWKSWSLDNVILDGQFTPKLWVLDVQPKEFRDEQRSRR